MEEEDAVGALRSNDSFTDVVNDLEAHKARELSLTLQNERLRSIVRQTTISPPISPRQNADCRVRILSNLGSQRSNREGRLVFGVGLLTILPIQSSFSVAEYVGYRVIEASKQEAAEGVWEKGRAFFDGIFGAWQAFDKPSSNSVSNSSSNSNGGKEKGDVTWEILWKKSVGTGNLCRTIFVSTFDEFSSFESLIKEWATAPSSTSMRDVPSKPSMTSSSPTTTTTTTAPSNNTNTNHRRTPRSNAGKNEARDSLLAFELAQAQQRARQQREKKTATKKSQAAVQTLRKIKKDPHRGGEPRRTRILRKLGLMRLPGSIFTWSALDGPWTDPNPVASFL